MIEEIFKYDIYSKIEKLDTMYKKENYISIYNLYKKYNDLLNLRYASTIVECGPSVNDLYYQSYIDNWYKE
jgi:hypothetical protein